MLIQFAIVLPLFLFLIGGVFDWAKFLYTYSTVSLAVTRTARCAAISYNLSDGTYSSQCSANYTQYLRDSAIGLNTTGMTTAPFTTFNPQVTVFNATGCNNGALTTVNYTYTFIFPNPFNSFNRVSLPITEKACMPLIQ
jgi:Flp pilus assembly protein TadG